MDPQHYPPPPSLSPISSLPPETLAHIFEIGLEFSSELEYKLQYPRTISQVNREWRDTAIATSLLWTTLSMHKRVPEWCLEWLQRSGDRSLDVHLNLADMSVADVGPIMGVVLPHARRWRFLNLCDAQSLTLVDALTRWAAPRLERLWISTVGLEGYAQARMRYLEPLVILEDSSNLKELRLSGTLPRACRPPLQTLTTFHIRLCEGQDCMDLRTFCEDFSNLKSLVTLVLEGPVVDCKDVGAGGDEFPHTVELPLLTTLVIDCRTCLDFYLAPLLDTLYLPILHTLVLRINDTEEWKSKLVGLNDMPLKFSALRTLHLESLTSIEFLSPLSIRNPFAVAFSEITSLVISHCTRKLLTNIRGFRGGSRPRWLKLRTLTIAFVWFVGDWDQFIEDVLVFVRSLRANGGSPIETLRLTCRDIMQDRWAVDSIRTELEEDGVRVEAIPADALDKGYEQWIPRGFREVSLPAEPEDLWAYVNE